MDLDPGQVLGAHEPVLLGADEPHRRAVVAVERLPLEMLGDQDVVAKGVLARDYGAITIESAEDEVGHRRLRRQSRLDHGAIEGGERDALPAEIGGGPPRDAVEIGPQLLTRELAELGERQLERGFHRAGDLELWIRRDRGRRGPKVGTEAGEPAELALSGRKRHACRPPSIRGRIYTVRYVWCPVN